MYGNVIGDARKLKALEELMGQEWLGTWCGGDRDRNPHGKAALILLKAFDDLLCPLMEGKESYMYPRINIFSFIF
jgi:hypothetical protein